MPAAPPVDTSILNFESLLNRPQAQAVTHHQGPLLVLAGAGSGKTRVITFRIANLLSTHRVAPYRILAVTFTNKAASEMRARLDKLVGSDICRDLWVGTFHATCAKLLRRHHEAAGLSKDFVIYDDADQKAVVARVLKALGFDDKRFPPKQMLAAIHQFKQEGKQPWEVPDENYFDEIAKKVYEGFEKHLQAASAVDFDDLILKVMRLAEDPLSMAAQDLRSRFSHVLVDEFQDANPTQYRLVRALVANHHNLCVVGDDDQSIYRWRGADVRIIRGFKKDFSQTEVIKLEENYRSSGCVVQAALSVIKPSREREPKELFTNNPAGEKVHVVCVRDERDEGAFVVTKVKEAIRNGVNARDIAIFYRIHAQSRVLEEAMRSENVPYQIIGGTRFFDRAEVKNLLAYLRVLANPLSDVDLLRIINIPARGIGQATIDKLIAAAESHQTSIHEQLEKRLPGVELAAASRKRVLSFHDMLGMLRSGITTASPRDLAERVLEATGYRKSLIDENTAEADARLENIEELFGSLDEYEAEVAAAGETASLSGYLERVSLVSDVDQMSDVARVPMMTVHAAKGLEFSLVLITGMEEDLFPYRRSQVMEEPGQIEEERRLAYVAITRARSSLYLIHAPMRMIFGTTRYTQPSRFIDDLPRDMISVEKSPSMSPSFRRPGMNLNTNKPVEFVTSSHPIPTPIRAVPQTPIRPPGERYVERVSGDDTSGFDEVHAGTKVSHARFGLGSVRSVDRSGSEPKLLVFFPAWGEKKVLVSHLKLE